MSELLRGLVFEGDSSVVVARWNQVVDSSKEEVAVASSKGKDVGARDGLWAYGFELGFGLVDDFEASKARVVREVVFLKRVARCRIKEDRSFTTLKHLYCLT